MTTARWKLKIVKFRPLLDAAPCVTITGPVVALLGTMATMLVSDQPVVLAASPLNVTVPADAPNPAPEIVTDTPGVPVEGARDKTAGAFSCPIEKNVDGEF